MRDDEQAMARRPAAGPSDRAGQDRGRQTASGGHLGYEVQGRSEGRAMRWLITDEEDQRLQGLTADAQVIYLRGIRRSMDYDSGVAEIGLALLRQKLETIPDPKSRIQERRVDTLTNHYIRARLAELERAELIEKIPKQDRFGRPQYRCLAAPCGEVRPESGPQENRKGRTASTTASEGADVVRLEDHWTARGAAREPQGDNRKRSGGPGVESTSDDVLVDGAAGAPPSTSDDGIPDCPHQAIIQAYHEELPQLPRVRSWHEKRQQALRARWREDSRHQSPEWWRRFFRRVGEACPFLLGDGPSGWRADLEWIVQRRNFYKILEGYYTREDEQ